MALGLSYLIAHYYSTSLFRFYHDWSGWRTLTGNSPNRITLGLEKVSWALLFCSTWWMLWRLDLFVSTISSQIPHFAREKTQESPPCSDPQKDREEDSNKTQRSENFVPEDDGIETNDTNTEDNGAMPSEEPRKIIFPTVEELEMAEVLGLPKEYLDDFSKIKSTYRIAIAQYHPDKVSALGAEIREVAEKKAKEINQAYEFFRRKFKCQ